MKRETFNPWWDGEGTRQIRDRADVSQYNTFAFKTIRTDIAGYSL
uniref:Uncharacterized protein n=1 Tax=uncultured Rhizobiales bacterium HF4000_32B18 TaxID=710780 RepID=E0XWF0_9HYPH|nr:hypothetical protein [uncultured Rhizobiales bacterium HF4000_32B18]